MKEISDAYEMARFYHEVIFVNMIDLRGVVDGLELLVGKEYWPYPTYGDIIYSVK